MLQRIVLLMYLWSCVESRFAFYSYTRHLHVVTHCIHIKKYICVLLLPKVTHMVQWLVAKAYYV